MTINKERNDLYMEQENNTNIEQTTVDNTEVTTVDKESNQDVETKETKTEKAEVKTFTQEQVNEMIKDRLAREKAKAEQDRKSVV